nr:histidine phosphatase family protein [Candidatus Sigynarchaeota archaeon]
MDILVIRHAKSSHDPEWTSDLDRPLTKKGRKRQLAMSREMAEHGISIDQIWVSPAARSKQTGDIIGLVLGVEASIVEVPDIYYSQSHEMLVSRLEQELASNPSGTIAIVGHDPVVSQLACFLTNGQCSGLKTSEGVWVRRDDQGYVLVKAFTRAGVEKTP